MHDVNIITLYKNKGDRSDFNNYRGIPILSIVGKAFTRVALNSLQKLEERVYLNAQCGFRQKRSPIDMVDCKIAREVCGTEVAIQGRQCTVVATAHCLPWIDEGLINLTWLGLFILLQRTRRLILGPNPNQNGGNRDACWLPHCSASSSPAAFISLWPIKRRVLPSHKKENKIENNVIK